MKKPRPRLPFAADLRRRAEERLRAAPPVAVDNDEAQRLLHELRIHQIELELQNEELQQSRAALEASAEKYADLYDFAPVSYLTLDLAGAIREANLTAATYLGVTRAKLLGQRFLRFLDPESSAPFLAFLDKTAASDGRQTCEVTLLQAGGPPRRVRLEGLALADGSGAGRHCRLILHDITEHARESTENRTLLAEAERTRLALLDSIKDLNLTQEALRESQAHLRFTLESARLGDWELDLTTDTARRSLRHDQCFGYTEPVAEWGFEKFIAHVHPEDRARVECGFRAATTDLAPWDFECRVVWPDGSTHWISAHGDVYRKEGKPVRMLGLVTDITARKQTEAALRASEANMADAQRIGHFGNWELDLGQQDRLDTNPLHWSDEVFRIFGIEPSRFGASYEAFLAAVLPADRERMEAAQRRVLAGEESLNLEHRVVRPDGTIRWVRELGELKRDDQGRVTRLTGTVLDITDQKAAEEKARSSAERLAQTLESITDSFFTLDRDWRFTYVNAEAERLLSRPRATLLGRSVWEAYPESVGSTFDREYRRAATTKTAVAFEEYYPPLEIWFEVKAYPTADGLAVYFRDVTERRRIGEALRTSESKFRQLAESNILGILFWDAEGNISDANDAFLQMVGYTREDLASGAIDWRHMTPPEFGLQDERALAEIAASGSCTPFEKEYFHKAGHRVAVLIGAAALDGAKDQGICYVVDISPQKKAEATLRVSEERFRLLAKATNDAIWDWDLNSHQLWWNEGYESLFGYPRAQADPTVRSWTNYIHPDDVARVTAGVHSVIDHGGESWSDEYRFRRQDGSYAHVLDRGYVIRDATGTPLRMIGGMTDLTKVKAHEIALSQSNRALQLLSRCNEALIRSETESGLLVDICQTAVDVGGFRLAWVGYALDDADKTIAPRSHAGVEEGYLTGLRATWAANDPLGQSPAGKVIRTGEPVVIPDIETDESFRPWRESALSRGFRGVIALPLADATRTFGVLVLYLPEVRQPLPDEMRLLGELASNMAFGIVSIRTRLDRLRIHTAVEQVAAAVSAATSEDFFEQLARNMALAVGAHAGFVAKLLPGEPLTARTIAAVVGDQVADNFDYVIQGTPCESFVTTDECVIHQQVADQFPRSPSLAALGAHGYVGRRLDSSAGKFLGLLFVIFREPLKQADFVTATLRIFAARAAAELERAQTDLQVREQAALLDKAQDAILVRDLDDRITYWNSSAERLFGWAAPQALGLSVRELLHAEAGTYDRALAQLLNRGEWTGELRHQCKDGRIIDIEGRWTLVRDAANQPKAILDISTDITERKRIAEQLSASEAGLAAAQARAHLGSWELELATGTGSFSAEMFRLLHLDPAQGVPGFAEFLQLVHPDDRAGLERTFADTTTTTEPATIEYRTHPERGPLRHLSATIHVIRDAQGQPVRTVGTAQDITERKRQEARFSRLVESNVQGVHFWKLDGRITDANDAFLRLTGRTREDLEAGRLNFHSLTPPEWAEADRRALVQLHARGVCDPFEKEYQRPDGSRVPVLLGAAFFEDQPDEGVAFVVDLTERKKLEQQFLRAQRLDGIGTLASGIAHDLNNALGPIILSLDLLKMNFPDAASQELLAIVASSAQRGADMVRQVLSFARGVEGRRMQVQVKHLLRDVEKILRDTFPKDIQVRTSIPPELWSVVGDPTQLHQVLLNLCVNARDAMPDGGVLTLSAQDLVVDAHYSAMNPEAHPGPYVFLQVEDSGTGMPPDVLAKIFDPFFTTKELGKGTGLGLSTSMGIVRSHGGFIRVYSEPGKGTTFKVYLPAVTQSSPATAAEEAVQMPRGQGELILVVDDEASVRQITQQTLEAFGYRVIVAADGAEAVAIHAREGARIAVVLTDMMMPIMDGPATIQALRRLNPAVPIIGASGLSANGHAARAATLGVEHFLPKPYTAEALLKALKAVLNPLSR